MTLPNREVANTRTLFKAQSAMEYLMTYGWAILIIGIALAALFELGVFNSANYAPRAQPGSCSVSKASYPVSLQGICTNQIPQYVPYFSNSWVKIPITNNYEFGTSKSFTISFWEKTTDASSSNYKFIFFFNRNPAWIDVLYDNSPGATSPSFELDSSGYFYGYYPSLSLNQWYNFVLVVDRQSGQAKMYLNGKLNSTAVTSISALGSLNTSGSVYLGCDGGTDCFTGQISNFQIYDSALSENGIGALYAEGIGGVPIDVTHIVGWWPLNGNTNDYSGNGNGGIAHNVQYTSSWTSGYSQP